MMYYSGIDKDICFEEFVAEFKLTARTNEWFEKDYALILGVYLQGPAQYFFRYTYHDDMDFATLCDLLRSEFPCECFKCKHRTAPELCVVKEDPALCGEGEPSSVELCVVEEDPAPCGEGEPSSVVDQSNNTDLYSSTTDDPQDNEPSDDDDDRGCDVSSQEDEDDQGCDVSSHDDTGDQGCDVGGQIDDNTEYTDEDKTPGVFNPCITISSDFIPDKDTFVTITQDDHDEVCYRNDYEEHHKLEIINCEFKGFLQKEKEMTQVVTKYDDRSPVMIHKVPKKRFESNMSRKKDRVPGKIKRCMAQKSMVNRKSLHLRHLKEIKSHVSNCKYYCTKFKKQFFLPKFKFWKFYKKKLLDSIFYNY
ncbi:hypothetical protein PYW08_016658 [Mythimna loreyi]|uniref:Uncharacterized protein n=1 Tax=Mythimna loreyi TaxID=667449 RepID=A0ACC2R0C8_9NEOP|nr:hypothetical protein PYW08_016658 [Mythimna loreyi]